MAVLTRREMEIREINVLDAALIIAKLDLAYDCVPHWSLNSARFKWLLYLYKPRYVFKRKYGSRSRGGNRGLRVNMPKILGPLVYLEKGFTPLTPHCIPNWNHVR